jgi:hypothetical protein
VSDFEAGDLKDTAFFFLQRKKKPFLFDSQPRLPDPISTLTGHLNIAVFNEVKQSFSFFRKVAFWGADHAPVSQKQS